MEVLQKLQTAVSAGQSSPFVTNNAKHSGRVSELRTEDWIEPSTHD